MGPAAAEHKLLARHRPKRALLAGEEVRYAVDVNVISFMPPRIFHSWSSIRNERADGLAGGGENDVNVYD